MLSIFWQIALIQIKNLWLFIPQKYKFNIKYLIKIKMGCVKSHQNKLNEYNKYQLFDPKSNKLFFYNK